MIIIESVIIAVLVVLLAPIMQMLLRRLTAPRPKTASSTETLPTDEVLKHMLHKMQCETATVGEPEKGKMATLSFSYQGGTFLASFPSAESLFFGTASISFFSCFSCKLEDASVAERVCNEVNSRELPIKCTINSGDDGEDSITFSLHVSGYHPIDDAAGLEYLKNLLGCFFFARRTVGDRFDALRDEEPGDIYQNRQPYVKAVYAMMHAELQEQPRGWNRPWFETPEWTVEEFIARITGYQPEFDYKLLVNGHEIPQNEKKNFTPLSGTEYSLFTPGNDLINPSIDIQLVPVKADPDAPSAVNLFLSVTAVEERLYTIRVDYARPALPVTPYRPEGSVENEAQTRSLIICVHRGGPELFKAEAEYMAAEQGLVERCLSGDAAYSLYWGRVLFADCRYLEALHYLRNAFSLMVKPMQFPDSQSAETCSTFYELCFFLGVTCYQLGRFHDSYYYLDIIVQQHRLRWTQQYVLTLMALNDPRVPAILESLREMIRNSEASEPLEELNEFVDRQQIILDIRNGEVERAREALEKMLAENPDSTFALHYLAKLL